MKNEDLFLKYNSRERWRDHSAEYARNYAKFLRICDFRDVLIDIGCGHGRDVDVFSSFPRLSVIGIDKNPEEIEKAKSMFPNCYFQVQDIEKLTMPKDSVGAFFMVNVIHYVDSEKAFSEIFRVLYSKGYLFIHFNLNITDNEGRIDYHHKREDIIKLVSGFNIIQENIFNRVDHIPFEHEHKVLELILQKP